MKKIVLSAIFMLLGVIQVSVGQEVAITTADEPDVPQDQVEVVDVGGSLGDKFTLDFKDAPLSVVMDYLSETAGYTIISNYSMTGRISIISKQPVAIDDALSLINSAMKENGYAVVRTGKILKIVEMSDVAQMNTPVRSGSDPDKIAETDEVITHIIPIRFADAVALREDISSLLPETAVFTANQASNSLVITDTSINIRRIAEIVQSLDTQMTTVSEVKVFRLAYADAENVANVVNQVFQSSGTGSSSRNNRNSGGNTAQMFSAGGRGGRGGMGGMGGMGGPLGMLGAMMGGNSGGANAAASRVVAAEDEMTNSVVVSASAETLEVVGDMIKQLDVNPDEERKVYVYSLENADAENIKELLNNLFSQLESINENNTSGMGGRGGGFGGNMGGGGGTSNSGDDVSDETYIEADTDTNSLIILTSSKSYEKIEEVIASLDKPVPQVLIKVLIAELTVTNDFDLGMEFSTTRTRSNGDNYTIGSDGFVPDGSAGLNANMLVGDFAGKIFALQQEGKLNVLSRPYILTSNNQTASITVGDNVPFVTDWTYSNDGDPIANVDYQDVGILLEVTPYINPKGLVIMEVAPEISAISDSTVSIQGLDYQVFNKRSSTSKVAVRNGQTVVIGGLMQDDETEVVKKVPLLGDIPLLGLLFQHKSTSKGKTELLIFLTPQVAEDSIDLQGISEVEKGNSKLLKGSNENSLLNQHIDGMESVYKKE